MSYAKTRDALSKDPAVFALRELELVDADGDLNIKLRFPERYLTLKYETEALRNLWFQVFTEEASRLGAKAAQAKAGTAPVSWKAYEGHPDASSDENASEGTAIATFALTDEPVAYRPPSPRSMLASGNAKASAAAAKWGAVDDEEDSTAVHAPKPTPASPPRASPVSPLRAVQLPPPASTAAKPPPPACAPFRPPAFAAFGAPIIRVEEARASHVGSGDILDNANPPSDADFLDDWDD